MLNGINPFFLKNDFPDKYKFLEGEFRKDIQEFSIFNKAVEIGVRFSLDDLTIEQIEKFHTIKYTVEEQNAKKRGSR